MANLEVKQILDNIDKTNFEIMVNWMYDWWGMSNGDTIEEVICYMKHSLQSNKFPQTYGLFLNGVIIGMYQFTYSDDLMIRPDIYPWLANVSIDKKYRNKGYARYMLNTVLENAKKVLNIEEIYLYTEHVNFYEKFGFEFISDIDTYRKNPRIQRLYRMKIK